MSHDKRRSPGPVSVGKINEVHENPRGPVKPNEARKPQGRTVTSKQFTVQQQSQGAKRNDSQDCESALHPKQFAIEGNQLLQVLFPMQSVWHLKAGTQNYKMRGASKPQVIVKESLCK
ncbi:MAG: hypothetical protein ACRD5M_05795 [Candidatus Acidiferrales bacterium]